MAEPASAREPVAEEAGPVPSRLDRPVVGARGLLARLVGRRGRRSTTVARPGGRCGGGGPRRRQQGGRGGRGGGAHAPSVCLEQRPRGGAAGAGAQAPPTA